MAIADRLNKLRTDIEDTYTSINNLGGTIPSDKNTNNIPEAIESIYSRLPKVSDTGTNVSLSPTLKGRLGIVPKGNTYQESTTGKNLLPINQIQSQTINGITITNLSDGTIKINGTTTITTRIDVAYTKELIANTQYKFTNVNTRGTGTNVNVQDSNNNVIGSIVLNVSSQTFTPTTTQTITKMRLYIDSGQTFDNYILKVMLIKSSDDATKFEPYTNGASPNPDYPQEIQSATGTQKVVVSGKNLLPFTNQDYTYKNVRYYVQNGNLYLDGTSTGETYANAFKDIFSFYLEAGTYSFKQYSDNPTSKYCRKYSDNTNLAVLNSNNRETTFTLNERTQVYLGFYVYNQSFDNELLEIQLEQGTATSYQPYQEPQEVDIELGNIELNKIGDYEDYISGTPDNWVLYKNIGKVVLDGSENWIELTGVSYKTYYVDSLINATRTNDTAPYYSDYFASITNNQRYVNNSFFINSNNRIIISYNDITTVANFKTWLSTHNTELLYVLATGTTETITDTNLISQLNELYYLMSYDDTTNIDVTGNLPMRITASAINGE